jgi:hypothetical protein
MFSNACKPLAMAYTVIVAETTANLDWRPELQRRTTAARRYFFVRSSSASFNGRALTGERLRSPVSFAPVRQPRHVPGHPIGVGVRVIQARKGGRTMLRRIPARPEQTQSPIRFPLFAQAGRHAAELWLTSAPLSAGEFRDLRYRNLLADVPALPGDEQRREAFDRAFEDRLAEAIANEEVSHV